MGALNIGALAKFDIGVLEFLIWICMWQFGCSHTWDFRLVDELILVHTPGSFIAE
jgi:hypothetical protein